MKYAVAYEISSSDVIASFISTIIAVVILLIVFTLFFLVEIIGGKDEKAVKVATNDKTIMFINVCVSMLYIFVCFGIAILIFAVFFDYNEYMDQKKYYSEYQKGNYSVVSGKITDLQTTSDFFDTPDKYNVNGVNFYHYPGRDIQFDSVKDYGYIHKNGQQVRITYYHDKDLNRNIILKLETAVKK